MKPIEIEGFSARHPRGRVGRREKRQAVAQRYAHAGLRVGCHIFDQTHIAPSLASISIGGKPLPTWLSS
eukprot:COSAG06_NODE_6672_length_2831_cov_2.951318_3_plen_69_part_00